MKDFNKLLYDILLKIEKNDDKNFSINRNLILKYFSELNEQNNANYDDFERYLIDFYNFCFELPLDNMIREAINFKDFYGST